MKRRIWKCNCGRIIIKNYIKYLSPPICICSSDTFTEMTEKELRKEKLIKIYDK